MRYRGVGGARGKYPPELGRTTIRRRIWDRLGPAQRKRYLNVVQENLEISASVKAAFKSVDVSDFNLSRGFGKYLNALYTALEERLGAGSVTRRQVETAVRSEKASVKGYGSFNLRTGWDQWEYITAAVASRRGIPNPDDYKFWLRKGGTTSGGASSLRDLIERYKSTYDTTCLLSRRTAKGKCLDHSRQFARFVEEAGLKPSLIEIAWPYLGEDVVALRHYVVEVDGVFVDWTAGQFDEELPVPYVCDDLDEWVSWIDREHFGSKYDEPVIGYVSDTVGGRVDEEGIVEAGTWGWVGAGILLLRQAPDGLEVFLGLRSEDVLEPFVWGMPGGQVPPDYRETEEDIRESAVREFEEEVGYFPLEAQYTGIHVLYPDDAASGLENFSERRHQYHVFAYLLPPDVEVTVNPYAVGADEHDEFAWWLVDDLPADVVGGLDAEVQMVWERLRL